MSLESGPYTIRNGGRAIGRAQREDRSLRPKGVFVLPPDVEPPVFDIEKLDSGNYTIKAKGAPTTQINNLVFALLIEEERAEKWQIVHIPQHGRHKYIIQANDQVNGWVAPEDPEQQILSRPLIIFPSEPPQYPPNEIFEIIPVYN
ncbi:hypothetical protein Moror_14760 [Moniliophthora roreri MCA 2997]|uniref:Serine protease inhibitor n=1 Tax=Moniliophthora roreri (strain MCA 2997) TaxID=1381753 RepID=V2Y9L4_MONRO|nr:hypothetical protein Moror_14760 [Moniliophthora roreri MCA 2997]KAI3609343.1 hypothetical protein WG66_010627 [Moniliophthora roreri]